MEMPSMRYMETYEFIKWATEHWKELMKLYKFQYNPKEPDVAFLENSIQKIEMFKKENYHMCIFIFLMENMSFLSDSICSALFKVVERALWDEREAIYFEERILQELKSELEAKRCPEEKNQ